MSAFRGLEPALIPFAEYLLLVIRTKDPTARISSVRRSRTEQSRLWRRWLAGLSKYPAARPGTSKHERGLAFDIVASESALAYGGKVWESWGGTWGGRFNDPIHFEIR